MEENKNIEPEVVVEKPEKDIAGAENQAVISFVLGLIGLFMSWIIIGIICGIFAITLGRGSRKTLGGGNNKSIFALIGEITGWIAVVGAIIVVIFYIWIFIIAGQVINEYGHSLF